MIKMRAHTLGAEELIELGRPLRAPVSGRTPFLANRPRRQMGRREVETLYFLDILGSVGGFLASGLSFALNTLGDIINVPLNILSQGIDIAFTNIAGVLENIPIIGDLLAKIVVLGGSLIKFGLSIPGLALHGLGNVMGGIAKALDSKYSDAEKTDKVEGAKEDIVSRAPDALKENVKAILGASGITGRNLTSTPPPLGTLPGTIPADVVMPGAEASDLEKALTVGIPVAGAVALLFAIS